MATLLYRLGRFAYLRRGRVLLAWLLIFALAGFGAARLSGPTSTSFSIPGTQSQQALDLLAQRMPQAGADNATARIVFTSTGTAKLTDPRPAKAIRRVTSQLRQQARIAAVLDPFTAKTISADQRTGFATVTYRVPAFDVTAADRQTLQSIGRQAAGSGLGVQFGGTVMQERPGQTPAEGIGLLVAALVLLITFGAVLAAGIPLITAIAGVGLGMLGISIASGMVSLSSNTPTLALMLGLAVAIDYALFIVSRYRHELLTGRDGSEAAGRALGTAGSAVVFAGLTVVIALAALSVVGIPFLAEMGLAAAGTVLLAVLIALTLLPALLGFLGPRVLGRKGLAARDSEANGGSDQTPGQTGTARRAPIGERWAAGVIRHRVIVVVAAVGALGAIAVPALDLRLGLPYDGTAAVNSTQRQAYDQISAAFGPGLNGPLLVVADLGASKDRASTATAIRQQLERLPDTVRVTPASFNPAGDTAILTVIPGSGPDDAATATLVHGIRDVAPSVRQQTGAALYVTGQTAVNIDVSDRLRSALLPYLAVVVGLAFVLLTLVFRSLLVPLKATLGFLLSIAATFGAVVAVFQWGLLAGLIGLDTTGPVLSFLPIFLIGVLFGLAMDYEVFLVTRMREEHVHGADANTSVVLGFRHGARVVTAAAVIMTAVFAGFALSSEAVVKSMGFALAAGVLVDAFVIRMTVVPAVMSLLGDRAWWLPGWLDQRLPDVDVEGRALAERLEPAVSGASEPVEPAGVPG